jgi:hypothetical protein
MAEEGHVLSQQEEIEQAFNTLRKNGVTPRRGDGFDVGSEDGQGQGMGGMGGLGLAGILGALMSSGGGNMTNPIANALNLTPAQAENVRSLIVGGGSAAIYKYLSRHIGSELAGIVAGGLTGYVAKKVIKG